MGSKPEFEMYGVEGVSHQRRRDAMRYAMANIELSEVNKIYFLDGDAVRIKPNGKDCTVFDLPSNQNNQATAE